MKELLSFCSRNGFLLPPVSSEIEQNDMGSSASLNTISAAEEETKQTLWMRIKSKVKKGITTKLQQSNILSRAGYEQPGYQKEIARRVQLIDLLMVLFPIDEILDLYIKTRLNKLEQVMAGTKKQSVSWADEEDVEKVCVTAMFFMLFRGSSRGGLWTIVPFSEHISSPWEIVRTFWTYSTINPGSPHYLPKGTYML